MAAVLHLMPRSQWLALGRGEPIINASLAEEGFIHCTDTAEVLLQVANAFYAAELGDFVAVHIDTTLLTSTCIWEPPAHIGGSGPAFATEFPHIYGPINGTAVVGAQAVVRDADGRFVGYDSVAE